MTSGWRERPAQRALVAAEHARRRRARDGAREAPRPCRSPGGRRMRAHIIGVVVSDTTSEIMIATDSVIANSRKRRPTMPPISRMGMNTATSERLIESTVKPTSRAPMSAAWNRGMPALDVARDVLQHDDGVVDHEAGRDGQRHQRQVVEAEAQQIHRRRRCRAATAARRRSGSAWRAPLRRNRNTTRMTRHDAMISVRSTSLQRGADGGRAVDRHGDVDRRRDRGLQLRQ